MSYYPTIEEDLARAKEILARGSYPVVVEGMTTTGTIIYADSYAAYELIKSFVQEIEDAHASEDAAEQGWQEALAEVVEADALRERLAGILTRTANALHGGPNPQGAWSWHDLPELVDKLRDRLDEAQHQVLDQQRRAEVAELALRGISFDAPSIRHRGDLTALVKRLRACETLTEAVDLAGRVLARAR